MFQSCHLNIACCLLLLEVGYRWRAEGGDGGGCVELEMKLEIGAQLGWVIYCIRAWVLFYR